MSLGDRGELHGRPAALADRLRGAAPTRFVAAGPNSAIRNPARSPGQLVQRAADLLLARPVRSQRDRFAGRHRRLVHQLHRARASGSPGTQTGGHHAAWKADLHPSDYPRGQLVDVANFARFTVKRTGAGGSASEPAALLSEANFSRLTIAISLFRAVAIWARGKYSMLSGRNGVRYGKRQSRNGAEVTGGNNE
jgi:hypothetical protein